jgi:hypothetical protein
LIPENRAVIDQPAQQGLLESNIHACLFAFDPLVPQNLVPLARERLVKE